MPAETYAYIAFFVCPSCSKPIVAINLLPTALKFDEMDAMVFSGKCQFTACREKIRTAGIHAVYKYVGYWPPKTGLWFYTPDTPESQ